MALSQSDNQADDGQDLDPDTGHQVPARRATDQHQPADGKPTRRPQLADLEPPRHLRTQLGRSVFTPQPLSSEERACKVLVVDDEPSIVNILSTLLSSEGYEVDTALSGEQALAYLQSNPVDVLVTDIRMDGMNGFELITETRKIDPYVRVIVITAHDCYDMIHQALQHDAYDYLTKPLENHEVVISSINRAAAATRLHRDNANLLEQVSASHAMIEDANRRLRELNDELIVQASTDGLTGLRNRRHLDESLEREVARRNRYPDPLALVMLDIDRFKQFNDEHGHEGGDMALQSISRILIASVRNIDVVGRFGGEEFLIILPKTSPDNAVIFAERLRRTIETSPVTLGNTLCTLTASIGVTGANKDQQDVSVHQLMAAADKALYSAKDAGRNKVVLREPDIDEGSNEERKFGTG